MPALLERAGPLPTVLMVTSQVALGSMTCRPVGAVEDERVCADWRVPRLNAGASFAQVDGVSADVAGFERPILAQGSLDGEVPLLGIGNLEFSGNGKAKDEL